MKLFYPTDFINRAKELYPEHHKLHECLDTGSSTVGRCLEEQKDESEEKRKLFEEWKYIFKIQN